MKTIKLKAKQNVLCLCLVIPCFHFTMADHAIMLPKTKETKQLVRDFNLATFVQNLCHSLSRHDKDKAKKIMKRVLKYRLISRKNVIFSVNVNQEDPSNGKTALHYAYKYNFYSIIRQLSSAAGIDVERLDHEGLPADAYCVYRFGYPSITVNNIRIIIAQKSKKLFNYLFNDITPQSWSSSVFANIEAFLFFKLDDEQRRKLIHSIRDEKGNTLLHYAAKTNKRILINLILKLYPESENVRNSKGKLPIQYSKNIEIFNCFKNTGEFYRQHFLNYLFLERNNNPVGNILMHYPDIIAHYEDTRPYICSNLRYFVNFISYLAPEVVRKISTFARDPAHNTLFHMVALWQISFEMKRKFYEMLDPAIINLRNEYGDTPLHLCTTNEEKLALIEMGAHPDCVNCKNYNPIKYANGNELIMCSLQCLAARKVKSEDVPQYLKTFVICHHAEDKNFNFINIQIVS